MCNSESTPRDENLSTALRDTAAAITDLILSQLYLNNSVWEQFNDLNNWREQPI